MREASPVPWRAAAVLISVCATAAGASAQAAAPIVVSGVVQDQTGAVLPGATVELVGTGGGISQSAAGDATGTFRFENSPPGAYERRATFEASSPPRFACASARGPRHRRSSCWGWPISSRESP